MDFVPGDPAYPEEWFLGEDPTEVLPYAEAALKSIKAKLKPAVEDAGEAERVMLMRLAMLLCLLVDVEDPELVWSRRAPVLRDLRASLPEYLKTAPRYLRLMIGALEIGKAAAAVLLPVVEAELDGYAALRAELEPELRALYKMEHEDPWGRTRGARARKIAVARKAVTWGLDKFDLAKLESVARLPMPDWPGTPLITVEGERLLYLGREDEVGGKKILSEVQVTDAWDKAIWRVRSGDT